MSPRPRRPPKERPPDPVSAATPWRLFVAVPLPEAARTLLGELTAELAAEGWPVRWVAAEGAHLSLHFLGETEPARAQLVKLALAPVVVRHAAFELRTAGLGVFPNLRRPRVLWLGLHGPSHRLDGLQREVGEALARLDFAVEAGPFNPHLTLGRVRNSGTPDFALRDLPEAIRRRLADAGAAVPTSVPVPVREVELVRSFLGPGGARYEPVARYPLADGEGAGR